LGFVNGLVNANTITTVISIVQDMYNWTRYVEKNQTYLIKFIWFWTFNLNNKSNLRWWIERMLLKNNFHHPWVITTHKSQGLSLQNAVMDISNSVFSCDQVVALSWVTSLNRLHLMNYDPSSVIIFDYIITNKEDYRI